MSSINRTNEFYQIAKSFCKEEDRGLLVYKNIF